MGAALGGGTINADTATVYAMNTSDYDPDVDSVNAAVLGGSGATATNTDNTDAITTIGANTAITAYGLVTVGARTDSTKRRPGAA